MCGIAGYSCWGDYDDRLNTTLPILAIHMEQRGRKSWGFTNGNDVIYKSLGEISEGLNPSLYGYKQAALHTRHPTTGSLTADNSHPFKVGNVIGMHNGVVRNHAELQKTYNRNCAVDSEHIFHHIDGGLSLKEVIAYGAIVYWQNGRLYMGRFNGGELAVCKTENSFVFASTKQAISIALKMSGLSENTTFYNVEEDHLYYIDGDTFYDDGKKLNFGEYNVSTYGSWDNFPYNGYTNNYGIDWDSPGVWEQILDGNSAAVIKKRWNPIKKESVGHSQSSHKRFGSTRGGLGIVPVTTIHLPESTLTHKSTNERIMQLIEDAAKSISHEHKGESWPCGVCNVKLFDGMPYFLTDDEVPQLVCDTCAQLDTTSLLNEVPLRTLPNDIALVSAFFEGGIPNKEAEMMCETCDEKLSGDEFFVHTKENTYDCLQCFVMGEEELAGYREFGVLPADENDLPAEESESDLAYQTRNAENLMQIQEMTEQEYVNDESPAAMSMRNLV